MQNSITERLEQVLPKDFTHKSFEAALKEDGLHPFTATGLNTLQINLGRLCNQACAHCHVKAGPGRTEIMERTTMEFCLKAIKESAISTVDITGGAPEMNPEYKWFINALKELGCRVITRTNLTILIEKGFEEMPDFFAENGLEVVASLPCYTEETTDAQRGAGVYGASIEALKRLNSAGYATGASSLPLSLVYNPSGPFSPPPQDSLEAAYKRELKERHNVNFTNLFTITNMPVGRFLDTLKRSEGLVGYVNGLVEAYNSEAARNVMCRSLLSVGWCGTLYDCDFNAMLGLGCSPGTPAHISEFDRERIEKRRIVTGAHCYGCTAGHGSSCTGATT